MLSKEKNPNKIFLNLENNNFISKELIKPNNDKIIELKEILEEMRIFYEDLYSHREIINVNESSFQGYQQNMPKLTDEESS